MKYDILNLSWVEKYRPVTVANVISPHTETIKLAMLNINSMQHMLFYSKVPGTGKTSMAKAIVNDLKADCLLLNSSDERNIDIVRTKIKDFARSMSSNNLRKVIILDEMEKMTKDAQDSLRGLMEQYTSNVLFIMTCNNVDKVIEAIQSRCLCLEFIQPDEDNIFLHLQGICINEKLKFTTDGIEKIIDIEYPSIRNMIKTLQYLKTNNLDVSIDNIKQKEEEFRLIWDLIKNQNFTAIHKKILNDGIDVEALNNWIFYNILKEDIDIKKQIKVIQAVADASRYFSVCSDKNLEMLNTIIKLIVAMA